MLAILGMARARVRGLPSWATGAALLALTACEVPEAPRWDVGVAVPFSADEISITDLLPDVVDTAVVRGEPVFTVEPQGDSVGYSLGEMCPDCQAYQGLTVPVPGFDYVDSLDVRFPTELASVELLSARLAMRIFNGLNFDPLRPGAGGYVAMAVRDLGSGALLDSLQINGDSESLPENTSKAVEIDISDATITEGVRAKFYIHSPNDGQTVEIQNGLLARFRAALEQIYVTAVTVEVDTDTLTESFPVDIDSEVRDQLAERVQSGEYELELIHDAELDGLLDVYVAGSSADLFSGDPSREVRLGPLSFVTGEVQSGSLTPAEIALIASFPAVYVGYRGVAWGTRTSPLGRVNLSRFTPDQTLHAEFRVISQIRVGE